MYPEQVKWSSPGTEEKKGNSGVLLPCDHRKRMAKVLNQQRFDYPELCNSKIVTQDGIVNVHKIVLSVFSNFFNVAFSNEMFSEAQTGVLNMPPDLDVETLEKIVSFLYTGELTAEEEITKTLRMLNWADFFHSDSLYLATAQQITRKLNLSNSLEILTFSKRWSRASLQEEVINFMVKNFDALVKFKIFPKLDWNDCFDVAKRRVHAFHNERNCDPVTILDGMIEWSLFNNDTKSGKEDETDEDDGQVLRPKLNELLSLFDLDKLLKEEIDVIARYPTVEAEKGFYQRLIRKMKFKEKRYWVKEERAYEDLANREALIVLRRLHNNYCAAVYLFDEKRWYNLEPARLNVLSNEQCLLLHFVSNEKDRNLYIHCICQKDNQERSSSDTINITTFTFPLRPALNARTWNESFKKMEKLTPLSIPDGNFDYDDHRCALIDVSRLLLRNVDKLSWYRAPEETDDSEGRVIEQVDFASRLAAYYSLLQKVPSDENDEMRGPNDPKTRAAVTNDGKLFYVIGGRTATGQRSRWVWCYDSTSEEWKRLADLPEPRSHSSAIFMNGRIYLFGGITDGSERMEKCEERSEIYDPESDEWFPGATLRYPKSMSKILVRGKELYIVGGFDFNTSHGIETRPFFEGTREIEIINYIDGSIGSLAAKPRCDFISGCLFLSLTHDFIQSYVHQIEHD